MRSGDCIKLEAGDLQLSLLPSNSVGNYNDQPKNISNVRSTVNSSLITDTTSLSSLAPAGNVDTDHYSLIEESIRLSLLLAPAGHSDHNLRSLFHTPIFLLVVSLNLWHVSLLDSESVVLPCLTSFCTSTHIFTLLSHQIPQH